MIAIDTNILLYAFDTSEPKKSRIAQGILERIGAGEERGVLSVQNLAEFCAVLQRKSKLPAQEQVAFVRAIMRSPHWRIVTYSPRNIVEAIGLEAPFWDGLLASTLLSNAVSTIITENVKDFEGCGIKAENPFV